MQKRYRFVLPRSLTCLLLAVLLPACGVFPARQKTPLRTYVLSLDHPSSQPSEVLCKHKAATLLVNQPRAQAGLDSPRMAYLKRPFEINYYAHNQWADSPARLLTPLLVQAIENTGCWQTVVQMPAAVQGDYRLDTEILHWQQEFFWNPVRFRITLRAQLVDQKDHKVIAARRFEASENASSEDAIGGVIAANAAVGKMLEQVANWVSAQTTTDG